MIRMTKIVCTLGPATDSYENLKRLVKAGMSIARLNFSHGTYDDHAVRIDMVKKVREELNMPVAIMLDTKGPEIRIRAFEKGKIELQPGAQFILTTDDIIGNVERVAITYSKLPKILKTGNKILINDGLIELEVTEIKGNNIICKVIEGGELSNRKSINIPDIKIDMPYLSDIDKQDIIFGVSKGIDYIALSFVRCMEDVQIIRKLLKENNASDVELISKIENRQGVTYINEILNVSDGIMVARGDMGVEIPFEELPYIQKDLIKRCYRAGKKVITATQMLESMVNNPRPTRAEISDVANAVFDGTSATMLSGETAVGKYAVQAVKTMAKVASEAEKNINYRRRFSELDVEVSQVSDAISHAACSAAHDLDAKAIIVVTQSGSTARKISRFRPAIPIVAATTSDSAYQKLALSWGVTPVKAKMQKDTDTLFEHAVECALTTGIVKKGDLVVICAGVPVGVSGNTNILKVVEV